MNESVDILIPVYNGAKYIKRCLDSILNQTYENINIVVLNDGSIDESLNILKEYELKDNRIKLYSKENEKFVSLARNYLLNKIESKYFIFVDIDDVVSKNYIKVMMDTMNKYDASMVCCEYTIFKSFLSRSNKAKHPKTYYSQDAIPEFVLGRRGHFMLWNKLIKTELIKNINFNNNIHYGEDMFFILDVMQHENVKVISITNKLYYYRFINLNSISKGGLNENKKAFLETLIEYEKSKRYQENTRIITTWIYLTSCYYQFLARKNKDKEYYKYLKEVKKVRKDNIKAELERIVVLGKL